MNKIDSLSRMENLTLHRIKDLNKSDLVVLVLMRENYFKEKIRRIEDAKKSKF